MNARERSIYERGGPAALAAEAERQVEARRRAKLRTAPKRKASREGKASRVAERLIRLKVAREVASARAGGKCEVCHRPGFVLEADHLVSGGLRRHRESAETLLMECPDCHRARHRGDMDTLRAIKETCIRLGMREGLRAIERRIDKAEEARRA